MLPGLSVRAPLALRSIPITQFYGLCRIANLAEAIYREPRERRTRKIIENGADDDNDSFNRKGRKKESGEGGYPRACGGTDAVKAYTGGDYLILNRELRGVREPSGKYDATVQGLDTMLSRASMPEATTVYRGVGSAFVSKYEGQIKKGFTSEDPGFVSTSSNTAVSRRLTGQSSKNITLEIMVQKGGASCQYIIHY